MRNAKNVVMYLLLTVAGAAANTLAPAIISDGIFAYGVAASIFIALRYRPVLAIPAAFVIAFPLTLHHPLLAVAVLVAQPLILSLFCYPKRILKPLIYAGFFWSLVALPIIGLAFMGEQIETTSELITASIISWLGGVVGLLIGHISYCIANRERIAASSELVPARGMLSYIFASLLFLIILVIFIGYLHIFQKQQKMQIDKYIGERTGIIAEQVEVFLERNQSAVNLTANLLAAGLSNNSATNEAITQYLQSLAVNQPHFLTFLVANEQGEITNSYPPDLKIKAEELGYNSVAARPYFSQVQATEKPYLSNAFQGKGFGNDLIVAISSPIMVEKQLAGIVEGSLSLSSFAQFDKQQIPGFAVIIEDAAQNVVYASERLALTPLMPVEYEACLNERCAHGVRLKENDWLGSRRGVSQTNWHVRLLYDFSRFTDTFNTWLLLALGVLLCLALLSVLVGHILATVFTAPMNNLVRYFESFAPDSQSVGVLPQRKRFYVVEINQLNEAFSNLQERLINAFKDLAQSRLEQKVLNKQLRALNISLEEKVEEKTQSLKEALDKAKSANESKSQFLANMSHEIRTPMNGILGSCENLLEMPLPDGVSKKIEVIHYSASHLLSILNSILDWSKIEAGKMTLDEHSFSMRTLVDSVLFLNSQAAQRKNVLLRCTVNESVPEHLLGDGGKLNQIINNLLSNAIKFTQSGTVSINVSFSDDQLQISIADSGIGMSKEQLARIFDQFEQADSSTTRVYGGTGLGLSITSKLIELMGGTIQVTSKLRQGTTFTVSIPFSQDVNLANANVPVLPHLPQKLNVLLVEDNHINAEIVADIIKSQKWVLLWAKDGQQALDVLSKHHFDLILMDCQMPVMDGLEASRQIRARTDDKALIPIIALTANAFEEDKQACHEAGMDAHLAKPFKKEQLLNVIATTLKRTTSIS
ncbi:ATP-binding protein [Alteromonas ponticola]|uniref:histidine kinase n=1 Tax=Alteromonas ponticola TaxID=2720613 RepID=A0ABX1R4F8_9ALTE|nr:ATP-binding protein [Alteromonas ponticola]NMH60115.1 response regulator [Alteromonas ponticola]